MRDVEELEKIILACLTDDLVKPEFKNLKVSKPTTGHCYVASEALYHLLGGKSKGYTPMQVKHEAVSHWFLRGPQGEVLDITASQFDTAVPYDKAVGRGFLTKHPSKRAQVVLDRVNALTA